MCPRPNSNLAYPMILGAMASAFLKITAIAAALVIKQLRFSSLVWLAAPVSAFVFLLWINAARIEHIQYVSAQGGWHEKQPVAIAGALSSAPELAVGNGLILPEHLTGSYHWIAQTQRMFSRGEWRVRHVDYENAPFGRAVHSPSPYRWWLGLIAWCHHLISGRLPIQSVEAAALVADPLLHFLLLVGTTLLIAWRFGSLPAALVSLGLVFISPFAAQFLPGVPDDRGLAGIFSIGSVLLLIVGVRGQSANHDIGRSTRRWFFLGGVAGGLGLWLSVSGQLPILAGIVVGAVLAAWVARNHRSENGSATTVSPWRTWAVGGAITTLVAYLLEFAPAHLGEWQLAAIHPIYGVAWLGGGEVLAQVTGWIQRKKFERTPRNLSALALALAAIAAVPVAIAKAHGRGFLLPDPESLRLTKLPGGAVAQSFGAWISRDGLTLPVLATLLPLLLIVSAVWLLIRRPAGGGLRVSVALASGPVLVALGFACRQLVWWNSVDGLLLVLLVAAMGTFPRVTNQYKGRLAWAFIVSLLLAPGVWQIAPRIKSEAKNGLTEPEVFGLVERDLGGWLELHADMGGAVILAPSNETTALCYYGGLRGIGTLSWENKEGVEAAMRIMSVATAQEAKELIGRRGITHIILLSWDSSFDEYARAVTGNIEGTFRDQLHFQKLPPWLRPVAYQLPMIAGFEGQSATIYEVVEDQDEATALSHIVEYLIEMGDLDEAASVAQGLRRFPADFGPSVARAELELARGDEAGFAKSIKMIQSRLAAKAAPFLPWDERVGLAVILAKAKLMDRSRSQVKVCLATADESKLRTLSTGSLYRLLVLSRAFGLTLDPKLRELALDLSPSELRDRLE
jgi:hypothetical protein